jgi:hypothetical protein
MHSSPATVRTSVDAVIGPCAESSGTNASPVVNVAEKESGSVPTVEGTYEISS